MKNKIYLCKYSSGSYDDYGEWDVFATFDKDKAQKWVDKFNTKLEKWKEYMISQRDPDDFGGDWPKFPLRRKYWKIIETNEAFIEEIEIR